MERDCRVVLAPQINVQSDKHFSGLENRIGLNFTSVPSVRRARCFSGFFPSSRFLISFYRAQHLVLSRLSCYLLASLLSPSKNKVSPLSCSDLTQPLHLHLFPEFLGHRLDCPSQLEMSSPWHCCHSGFPRWWLRLR